MKPLPIQALAATNGGGCRWILSLARHVPSNSLEEARLVDQYYACRGKKKKKVHR